MTVMRTSMKGAVMKISTNKKPKFNLLKSYLPSSEQNWIQIGHSNTMERCIILIKKRRILFSGQALLSRLTVKWLNHWVYNGLCQTPKVCLQLIINITINLPNLEMENTLEKTLPKWRQVIENFIVMENDRIARISFQIMFILHKHQIRLGNQCYQWSTCK